MRLTAGADRSAAVFPPSRSEPREALPVSSLAVQPIVVLLSGTAGGNPAQYMIEKAFAHHYLDWRYLTVEVAPEHLDDAIRGMRAMGFQGGHCGSPHKRHVIPLLDGVSDVATAAGAANLIYREGETLRGDNTEGQGLVQSLRGVAEPAGARVVVLGAGQIARAIGAELAAAGAAEITVVNRTEVAAVDMAEMLSERFGVAASAVAWEGDFELPPEANLLVNATSIGRDDPEAHVPLAWETLRPEMIVADVTFDPPQTRLLREAADRGCTTLDGLRMYIRQVAIGFERWTGIAPDREVMREAVEEFLEL
jgi:shikimate dehydrogenase